MLGVIGFLAICIFAAFFPTIAAVIIFGVVGVMSAFHLRDRLRQHHRR